MASRAVTFVTGNKKKLEEVISILGSSINVRTLHQGVLLVCINFSAKHRQHLHNYLSRQYHYQQSYFTITSPILYHIDFLCIYK